MRVVFSNTLFQLSPGMRTVVSESHITRIWKTNINGVADKTCTETFGQGCSRVYCTRCGADAFYASDGLLLRFSLATCSCSSLMRHCGAADEGRHLLRQCVIRKLCEPSGRDSEFHKAYSLNDGGLSLTSIYIVRVVLLGIRSKDTALLKTAIDASYSAISVFRRTCTMVYESNVDRY